jgi:hypothetical protein
LLEEADSLVEPFGKPFLYNELTRLAALPAMAGFADELRDRALQSLVKKLRGGLAGSLSAGAMVSALFGRAKVWPAAVVSDAEFAAGAELKRASAATRGSRAFGSAAGPSRRRGKPGSRASCFWASTAVRCWRTGRRATRSCGWRKTLVA